MLSNGTEDMDCFKHFSIAPGLMYPSPGKISPIRFPLLTFFFLLPPGYRCFKAIMFLSGLLFGSAVIFLLCYKERILDTQLSMEVSAGIALGIGVLCGLVTMLVHSVGLFLTGLLLGLLVATAGLVATEPLYKLSSAWVPAGSLLGTALLGAVLALRWQRALTVISTAVFGGAVLTLCLDYAVENLALGQHVYDRLRLGPSSSLCWCGWAVLATWPVLALMGVVLQWKVTAEGFSHTDGEWKTLGSHGGEAREGLGQGFET